MKLFYYRCENGNFGDNLNAWLWERLIPGVWDDDASAMMSGIGTIFSNSMPNAAHWIVLGSGAGYKEVVKDFSKSDWNILCVRGPLSAEMLGLAPEKAVTDGAILLSLLPEYAPLPESERHGVVFMPHHRAKHEGRWKTVCTRAGIEYIDPEAEDDHETLRRIRSAKLVIADAMHAAIVADTFRVPWVPVATSSESNTFKWLDWTMSMNVPYKPVLLPPSSRREAFRSFFLPFRGESYFLEKRTKEAAVQLFKARNRLRSRFWWPLYLKATGIPFHGIKKALKIYDSINPPGDSDAYIERAAAALQAVVKEKSYLSTDESFAKRRGKMISCLENAIKFINELKNKEKN